MKGICPLCGTYRGHVPRNGGFLECMCCNFLFKPEEKKLPTKDEFPVQEKGAVHDND